MQNKLRDEVAKNKARGCGFCFLGTPFFLVPLPGGWRVALFIYFICLFILFICFLAAGESAIIGLGVEEKVHIIIYIWLLQVGLVWG